MKAKKWACIATAAVMTASLAAIFAGCGEEDAKKLTVTWYDGRAVLKTDNVESGTKVTDWTPTKDGYEFKGWYAEASKSTKFDFTKAITEDTSVYSDWLKMEYVEDTNTYYAIGTGAGTMKASNWVHSPESKDLYFTKNDKVTNANEYTIELALYAGDRFQIAPGGWTVGRAGIGNIEGVEYADFAEGQNPYKPDVAGTAADKDYAIVKNDKGEVVFHGGNENNDASTNWNIVVTEGHDGVYIFTYHTYPGQEGNNYITWKLDDTKTLEPITETHKMHIIGGMNGWDNAHPENLIAMKKDGSVWTGFFTTEEEVEFKVFNSINGDWIGNPSDNFKAEAAGTYCVSYSEDTNKATFAKCEYYVVGTFLDGTNAVNFCVKDGVTPKMATSDDGATYTVTFTAADVTGNNAFSWMTEQSKPGVCAVKVVFGCELGIKDWYSDNEHGGDNFYLTAGEHTVTLTVDGGVVTVS